MPIKLTSEQKRILKDTLPAIIEFRNTFGRNISESYLAELLVASELDLTLADSVTEQGADAFDATGNRYQIKQRSPETVNIDINNFNFDYLILVNLDSNYQLHGMWQLTVAEAQQFTTHRSKFRKFQITQSRLKQHAKRIR